MTSAAKKKECREGELVEMSMQIGHFGIEYYVVRCFQMSAHKGSFFCVVS